MGILPVIGIAGVPPIRGGGRLARNWDNGRPARYGSSPYCTSTTTLKNRIAAFSAVVAPSAAFHSPPNVTMPFTSEHVT